MLSLAKKDKYLTEIGLVKGEWREGKKYFSLKDRRILEFLRKERPIPAEFRPKPPHEIVLDMWEDMKERLERMEKKVDKLEKKK